MKNDFFSVQSAHYAKYRPVYPQDLYDFIIHHVNERQLVWDVATGSGQAALALSAFFDTVYASDFSAEQLAQAKQAPNISYHLESAESSSLANESVDLITVATALHWFDQPKFYAEADRVLKPNGVMFVWSYGGCRIEPDIDKVMDEFNFRFLYNYWHEGAKMNWEDKYQSIELPFTNIETPNFIAKANYTLDEVMNYMFSWSGVQTYIRQEGRNPLEIVYPELLKVWGDPEMKREIHWYLHSKCSRK
ncbi:MAG: class I SAM-dependent methyltransferase [Bacteroidetes bacterium]|nr:class I SAM-dependent methyltransferase [Bacteroidota bacterium]